jgi:hypothetical protein
MKRVMSALFLLTAATLGVAGCGDDDDDSGNGGTAGTPGTAGTSSSAGEPGSNPGAAGAASDGNVACDPGKANTCQNDTDCSFVADGTARRTAQGCGQMDCLGSDDEDCARDCMLAQIDMTSDCASCYAEIVKCTIKNCLAACIDDPDSQGCQECQVTAGCFPDFEACSGLSE